MSDQVAYPNKPDEWISESTWIKYQDLRTEFAKIFKLIDNDIASFRPREIEIIMEHVNRCRRFIMLGEPTDTIKFTINNWNLFKHIAKTRAQLINNPSIPINNNYPLLEYVKPAYVIETYPSTTVFKYKFAGNDTIYTTR